MDGCKESMTVQRVIETLRKVQMRIADGEAGISDMVAIGNAIHLLDELYDTTTDLRWQLHRANKYIDD